MTNTQKRIVILMSDTGGGHRSAAEAIADGLTRQFPGRYDVKLVDAIREGAVFPFNHMPEWYLPAINYAEFWWGVGFHLTNRPTVKRVIDGQLRWMTGRGLKRLLSEMQPDLVVSVHPLLTTVPRRMLQAIDPRVPFVVVVTDLTDGHKVWFDPKADLTLVPSGSTDATARRLGVPEGRLRIVGLPVSLKFMARGRSKTELRTQLGLAPDKTTVLLVGGGEGMGPLYRTARALSSRRLPIQLVIIAGRNKMLCKRLQETKWDIPVVVNGFVTNMPDWMSASDLIITKAGPGTIMEALACGLPILLSGFLPGQEEGNVTFVEENGVGVLRNRPDAIARTVQEWLAPDNDTLTRFAARARELARPGAVLEIAAILDDILTSHES